MSEESNDPTIRRRLLSSISWCGSRLNMYVAGGALLMIAAPQAASALNLYDGSNYGNQLEVNLTTTLEYTGIYRVNDPSAVLLSTDGDSNFKHGIVGNLFEAVPVLDIRDGDFGAHFSAQAYINTSYLTTNQNSIVPYSSAIYTQKQTDFSSGTRNVDGQNFQWLDAFAFAQHEFSNGQTVSLKVGRQTLFWGQSLYYPSDGISGGQAPINVISAQNAINPQAQQIFMPVGQAVFTYQPVGGTTIQGYYQFEWEHDYLQGQGAYFNSNNILDKGASYLKLGGNEGLIRTKDLTPPSQNGQFGLSFQQQVAAWDLGVFVERFDAKAPSVGINPGSMAGTLPHGFAYEGNYLLVYPRDTWLQGVSFSTNIGPTNTAGELSFREHQPLVSNQGGVFIVTPGGNANGNPDYPVGNTWNAQLSSIYVTPAIPFDPGGIAFSGEVIVNHLMTVTANRSALVNGFQGTAAAFDAGMTPTYNNVLPYLQVTFPISLQYNFLGRSAVDSSLYHGTGIFDCGISATYKINYIATLSYQDYFGRANPNYNGLADRGFVSLNLQHTF